MKYILFFIVISIIYYYYRKYCEIVPFKYDCYFVILSICYLLFFYSINNVKNFKYKVVQNLKNVHNTPLHNLIPDYKIVHDPLKLQLLNNQNFKCSFCKNNISSSEINNCQVSNINNKVHIICPLCCKKYLNNQYALPNKLQKKYNPYSLL